MALFLLFLAVPLIEIALFIQLGSVLDLGWILLIVVLTALLGTWLVRQQGRGVLRQIMASAETLRDPTEPLAHGAMILFSGALLLTPGFFTDAVGFLLLIPAVREAVFVWLRKRVRVQTASGDFGRYRPGPGPGLGPRPRPRPERPNSATGRSGPTIIDADYTDVSPEKPERNGSRPSDRPSGWTDR